MLSHTDVKLACSTDKARANVCAACLLLASRAKLAGVLEVLSWKDASEGGGREGDDSEDCGELHDDDVIGGL